MTPIQEKELVSRGVVWQDDKAFLEATIRKMTSTIWETNAERWRIYCLTPHPNSLLMWSHYGDRHKGICLEFDTSVPIFGGALQVMYRETLSPISAASLEDWERLASTLLEKSSDWRYEDEYRVLARDSMADAAPADFLPVTDKDFLSLSPGALTAVVAGCNADVRAIRSIVREHAPDIKVKACIRAHNKYTLSVEVVPD
jgi:hypothetical protein